MSNFKKVNVYDKLLCFILFFVAILFIDSYISLLLLLLIFLIISKANMNNIFYLLSFLTIFGILSFALNGSYCFMKGVMLLDLIYYFTQITTLEEIKGAFSFLKKDNNSEIVVDEEPKKNSKRLPISKRISFSSIKILDVFYIASNVAILVFAVMVG